MGGGAVGGGDRVDITWGNEEVYKRIMIKCI